MTDEAGTPKRKKLGRPPSGRRKPDEVLTIPCNWEWKVWVRRYAESRGLSMTDAAAAAFAESAKRLKFEPPPARIAGVSPVPKPAKPGD